MKSGADLRDCATTIAYGPAAAQVGDWYWPAAVGEASGHAGAAHAGEAAAAPVPVICLLHGGFWRAAYGRDYLAPLARDLMRRGYAVCNLEYRRVGMPGGGWPATLDDVAAGIDHFAAVGAPQDPHADADADVGTCASQGMARRPTLDLTRITVVGHSAGGQLALWAAGVQRLEQPRRVRISRAVALAPVADLDLAYRLGCGKGAVAAFLGATPADQPERYRNASPAAMLPLGVRQLLMHGTADADVPVDISRSYVTAARAAGDDVDYLELDGMGHMEFADPDSAAHALLCRWLSLTA